MRRRDSIDRKLLQLLQEDDRQSLATLGKKIGAPASTINDRIRRLTRQGMIAGFHARQYIARYSPKPIRWQLR